MCVCEFNLHSTSRHTTSMDSFVCSVVVSGLVNLVFDFA